MAGGGPTVDTAVSETLSPAASSYPIGIGTTFTANASATSRVMDVYVFGFDSDVLLSATLSGGGSTSTVVTPTFRPPNDPNNERLRQRRHLRRVDRGGAGRRAGAGFALPRGRGRRAARRGRPVSRGQAQAGVTRSEQAGAKGPPGERPFRRAPGAIG
jgi:hypothetical protein